MTLIPSIVNLTLANTSPTAIEQGQAFIDCVGWTNALREAIDTDGERALLAPAQAAAARLAHNRLRAASQRALC